MKLRYYILVLLLLFGLAPLSAALLINLPLVVERTTLFYQKAYLQNLRADFRDLDQHLASRDEMLRLLAKLPGPGTILGVEGDDGQTELARARYTEWINQMLPDQRDIVEILFVDRHNQERFWLQRAAATGTWQPTDAPPAPSGHGFLTAASKLQSGEVIVSRIRVNPYAGGLDPRQLLTLQLASPLGSAGAESLGLLLMTIDVGGLAQFYRDTLWVNHAGAYLRPGEPPGTHPDAFADFPGLDALFAEGKLGLAKSIAGAPYLWVPMFMTEDGVPLWVGRPVDSSPIADFRNAMIARVLSIALVLVGLVLLMAHAIANRVERFGGELTTTVRHILRDGQRVELAWRGPREMRELAAQLSELSRAHAEHLASERQHTRQLERSNRYKSEFLTNVSHELRTPLNAILLLSKLLADADSGLDDEQRRQARVIHEAGSDLRALIDNILDISRLEAGQATVSLEWIELRPLLEELYTLTQPMFTTKGLAFRLEYAPDTPARLYSDRDKLRQILKNFLSNAAKFTHSGSVVLATVHRPGSARPVVISVTDTGIGVAPGKEKVIFEAFRQADGSTRRRYGGTGLGLSISRELAALLDGTIRLDSVLGQGSCFALEVPLALDPRALAAVEIIDHYETPPAAARTTVSAPVSSPVARAALPQAPTRAENAEDNWLLLVEREVSCLLNITAQIEQLGWRAQTAADLDEALETLREERGCALVLLAVANDLAHACASIERLYADPARGAAPIVALGQPRDEARARYLAAGAVAFLPKPVTRVALAQLLRELSCAPRPRATRAAC